MLENFHLGGYFCWLIRYFSLLALHLHQIQFFFDWFITKNLSPPISMTFPGTCLEPFLDIVEDVVVDVEVEVEVVEEEDVILVVVVIRGINAGSDGAKDVELVDGCGFTHTVDGKIPGGDGAE